MYHGFSGLPVFGEVVKMIDKQRVNELALEHKANMRGVSKTLADRDALSTSEAKLPLEVFTWRQSECYADSDKD